MRGVPLELIAVGLVFVMYAATAIAQRCRRFAIPHGVPPDGTPDFFPGQVLLVGSAPWRNYGDWSACKFRPCHHAAEALAQYERGQREARHAGKVLAAKADQLASPTCYPEGPHHFDMETLTCYGCGISVEEYHRT